MKSKKNILLISSLMGSALFSFAAFTPLFRSTLGGSNTDLLVNVLVFFPVILFFSLITYKLPERIFTSWWGYVRAVVPIVIFLLFLVGRGLFHSETAGTFGWGHIFNEIIDFFITGLLILLFIIGSIIQIYRGYKNQSGGLLKLFCFLVFLGMIIVLFTYYIFL